jgi:hypothetical protein
MTLAARPAAVNASRRVWLVCGAVLALALATLPLPILAPGAGVAVLVAFLIASREPAAVRKRQYVLLTVAAVVSSFSFVRFLRNEAIPGIVEGGTRATESRAVSRLREILFAEDVMRRKAELDHDGDGIGSAALLAELTGELGLRGARRLLPPLLERYGKSQPTELGPAHDLGGFFFVVCLPVQGGGFSAEPSAAVDEEAAERRFLAYAWPSRGDIGLQQAYFLDEHERIAVAPASREKRVGLAHPPSCDDAVAPATRGEWRPWQNKQPRQSLPGDGAGR